MKKYFRIDRTVKIIIIKKLNILRQNRQHQLHLSQKEMALMSFLPGKNKPRLILPKTQSFSVQIEYIIS